MRAQHQFLLTLSALALALSLAACGGGGATTETPMPQPPTPVTLAGAVDSAMATLMSSSGVSAATLTIMQGDQVLLDKGYGYRDAAHTQALPADALLPTASIVKPVTAAAIQRLASQGKLALTDHVFCSGSNAPCWFAAQLLAPGSDARLKDITIGHLLTHQGGWDRTAPGSFDLFFAEASVQSALKLSGPPGLDDDLRFLLATPLRFSPGSRQAYSNEGYLLLGRIVELASGQAYLNYVQSQILAPLGVAAADFGTVAARLADRNPREPNYLNSLSGPSVFEPGKTVAAIDGAVNSANWTAVATALTTSKVMAQFAAHYLIQSRLDDLDGPLTGTPLAGRRNDGDRTGTMPGSSTLMRQLPSGLSYALLMNKRDEAAPGAYAAQARQLLDAALAAAGY